MAKIMTAYFGFFILIMLSIEGVVHGAPERNEDAEMRIFAGWTEMAPVINGKLDDESWKYAGKVTNFILNKGESFAIQQTTAWVLYDQENLYLAFHCQEDEMDKLKATFSPETHDQAVYMDDCVEIFIDIGRSRKYYYHIVTNSKAAVYDSSHTLDGSGIPWDSHSLVRIHKGANFWTVEMSIPFKSLGKRPEKGDIWGLNLNRERRGNGKKKEYSCFSCTYGRFHTPTKFGDLLFAPSNIPGLNVVSWGSLGMGRDTVKFNLINKSASLSKLQATIEIFSGELFLAFDEKIFSNKLNIALNPNKTTEFALDYSTGSKRQWLRFTLKDKKDFYYRVGYSINPATTEILSEKIKLDLNIAPDLLKQSVAIVVTLFDRQTMKPVETRRIGTSDFNHVLFEIPEWISRENCIFTVDFFNVRRKKTAHFEDIGEFNEIFYEGPVSLPSLTRREKRRGYLLFSRPEPGDIFPTSIPARKEITDHLEIFATPGERTAVNFALYALNNLKEVKVELDDLKRKDGYYIKKNVFDLRVVKCWAQRIGWTSKTFHVIPELLEKEEKTDIPEGIAQQYYLTIKVPDNAVSGAYTSNVKITTGSGQTKPLKVILNVLPFKLQEPSDIIWGLYSDGWRWRKYTDERIKEELISIHKQGINALIMYAFAHGSFNYSEGKVIADLSKFSKYMEFYKEAGLKGPFVISIQGIDSKIRKWIPNAVCDDTRDYNDQAKDAFKQVIGAIVREAEKNNWPGFVFHAVDEPTFGSKDAEAIRALRLIKKAGYETFITCDIEFTREVLDPYLDYRCYTNIAYSHFKSEEQTARLCRETLEAGDKFWWYGSGCYTNSRIIQEGNVIANRFLSGYFLWRSKATGAWAWSFCRIRGDAFNDFDGKSKDVCIVYPSREEKLFIPTLQWEGIREGINDYKYLYTLSVLIEEIKKTKDPLKILKAKKIEREINRMFKKMPWFHALPGEYPSGKITNADLKKYRKHIVKWILELI